MTVTNRRRIPGYQNGGDEPLPDYLPSPPSATQTPTPPQDPPADSGGGGGGYGPDGVPDSIRAPSYDPSAPAPAGPGDWANTYTGPLVRRPSGINGVYDQYVWSPSTDPLAPPGSGSYKWHSTVRDPSVAAARAGGAGTDPRSFVLDAVREYLNAQTGADARRASAMSEADKMMPYALPAGSKYFPGFGPGGPAQQSETLAGARTFSPPTPTNMAVSPQKQTTPMPVDQFVQQMLSRVTG